MSESPTGPGPQPDSTVPKINKPSVETNSPTGESRPSSRPKAPSPRTAAYASTFFDQEEVRRLYKRFMKLDKDGNGTIDREEFLSIPQMANNPLAQRLIAIFDEDGGGDVDFIEFIKCLSVFSSKGRREDKLKFTFKVYDMDRDGYISNGELFLVLKMMVGTNLKEPQLQQIVDKTIIESDADGDGKLSYEEFCSSVEKNDFWKSMSLSGF